MNKRIRMKKWKQMGVGVGQGLIVGNRSDVSRDAEFHCYPIGSVVDILKTIPVYGIMSYLCEDKSGHQQTLYDEHIKVRLR